jgi:hypothetical protein
MSNVSFSPGFLKMLDENGITPEAYLSNRAALDEALDGEATFGVRIAGGQEELKTALLAHGKPCEIILLPQRN